MDELSPARALAPDALEAALKDLPAWRYDGERRALFRGLVLEDFSEAIGLMVRVAIEAEKADHHPEWTNVYNRLDIWLTTHDANGVSDRDLNLARRIDAMI
jgi:4a-hydroxytetrahydrobiopterin dehydratase